MVEFHAWITIRETYQAVDNEEENIDVIVEDIRNRIEKMQWMKPQIKAMNGEYFMEISSYSNHKAREIDELFDLFSYITETATGSYGLIYMLDDEDMDKSNEFQVFLISRGQIHTRKDTFLSPFIPIVEDPFE